MIGLNTCKGVFISPDLGSSQYFADRAQAVPSWCAVIQKWDQPLSQAPSKAIVSPAPLRGSILLAGSTCWQLAILIQPKAQILIHAGGVTRWRFHRQPLIWLTMPSPRCSEACSFARPLKRDPFLSLPAATTPAQLVENQICELLLMPAPASEPLRRDRSSRPVRAEAIYVGDQQRRLRPYASVQSSIFPEFLPGDGGEDLLDCQPKSRDGVHGLHGDA